MNLQSLMVPTLVTPIVLYVAMIAGRHAGPGAAGLVAALPLQLAIGALGVGSGMGDVQVAAFAVVASTFVPAQVSFGVAFTIGMRRGGPVVAMLAGIAGYFAVAIASQQIPHLLATSIGVIALAIGPRLTVCHDQNIPQQEEIQQPKTLVVTSLGTVGVLSVILLVDLAGPTAGALLAAIPVVTPILSFSLMGTKGREAGAETMTGMIRGLPSYFVFAVTLAFLAEPLGTITAVGIGLTSCVAVAAVSWRASHQSSVISAEDLQLAA